jgi:uncharacterized protein YndB with AHSA1/START domain
MWGKFNFHEIEVPSRISFESGFSDENGNFTRHPAAPNWPLRMASTYLFEDEGGSTRFTTRWSPIDPSPEERSAFEHGESSMQAGWSGTLDQLQAYLDRAA